MHYHTGQNYDALYHLPELETLPEDTFGTSTIAKTTKRKRVFPTIAPDVTKACVN